MKIHNRHREYDDVCFMGQFLLPKPNFHPCGGIIIDVQIARWSCLFFDFSGVWIKGYQFFKKSFFYLHLLVAILIEVDEQFELDNYDVRWWLGTIMKDVVVLWFLDRAKVSFLDWDYHLGYTQMWDKKILK